MTPRPLWHLIVIGLTGTAWLGLLPRSSGLLTGVQLTWPDEGQRIGSFVWLAVWVIITVLLIRRGMQWPRLERWLWRGLGADLAGPIQAISRPATLHAWAWLLGGLLVLLGSLVFLEVRQPYYFTQDDNLVQFLPVILQAGHSIEAGVWPAWNPYQLLGAPTTSVGTYALTYPPTYLAYFSARYLLGNEYLTLELFALIHLLGGYVAMAWAGRVIGLRPMLATLGSLSCVLSGYSLIAGRSWYYMLPGLIWAPLLVAAVARLHQNWVTWRWVVGTGLVIGLFFHAGNVQMWAYALLLTMVALFSLVWTGQISGRRALGLLPALALGLAIAAPLLIPQILVTANIDRVGGQGGGITPGLLALLLPFPLVQAPHPNGWGNADLAFMGQLYYSGTLFPATGLIFLASLAAYRWDKRLTGQNIWLICAGIALLLALGHGGILWTLLAELPGFDKFNHPFKFLAYVHLFLAFGAGLVLERQLQSVKNPQFWEVSCGLLGGALLLYHVTLARPSFHDYEQQPYPALPPAMAKLLAPAEQGPQRLLSFSPERAGLTGDSVSALNFNFASLFGLVSIGGYDPLVAATLQNRLASERFWAEPVQAAQAYGVRWLIVHHSVERLEQGPNPMFVSFDLVGPGYQQVLRALQQAGTMRLALPNLTLWELNSSSPLVFAEADPAEGLPAQFDSAGVRVDVSGLAKGGPVIINMLWRPEMIVYGDDQRLPSRADAWGRIRVETPAGTGNLEIRYAPPWSWGIWVGIILTLLAGTFTIRPLHFGVNSLIDETE